MPGVAVQVKKRVILHSENLELWQKNLKILPKEVKIIHNGIMNWW